MRQRKSRDRPRLRSRDTSAVSAEIAEIEVASAADVPAADTAEAGPVAAAGPAAVADTAVADPVADDHPAAAVGPRDPAAARPRKAEGSKPC